MTRILVVDDHEIVRKGLCELLDKQPDLQVVGEAENGRAAVQLAGELQPDVIVMDISMPDMNGMAATKQILRDMPNIRILALSMHPGQTTVSGMFQAGASGYLLKTCALEELVNAVRVVAEGKIFISPEIGDVVLQDYIARVVENQNELSSILSNREYEVLQLVAEGKASKEIASILNVTDKTIESHRSNIMKKLDLHSIAELTKYAVREGLTPLE
ncbi:MAG: response regulator transcription factor [Phycisphaerae bacterium]|nr:response regulator transcription factor [Phycisphaerae bacterium]